MKRIAISLCSVLGLLALAQGTQADGPASYGGQQPWWNIFARRPKLNPEEERLQRFWHDYYNSMKLYYGTLDRIDWVAYYKNHGYQINTGGGAGCYPGCGPSGGPQRIQFAPVFVSPSMQWMVPNSSVNGPPGGPQNPPQGVYAGGGFGPPGGGFGPPPGPYPPPIGGFGGYPPPGGFGPPGGGYPPPGPGGFGPPGGGYPPFGFAPPGGPMPGQFGPGPGPGPGGFGPGPGPGFGPGPGPGGPFGGPGGPGPGPGSSFGPAMGYNSGYYNGGFDNGNQIAQVGYNPYRP